MPPSRTATTLCAVAIAVGLCLLPHGDPSIAGTGTTAAGKLGDPAYCYEPLVSPTAVGAKLRWLAWLLARTPLGPTLRRHLVNANGISELRELAAQVDRVPADAAPLRRMTAAERAVYDAEASRAADDGLSQATVLARGLPGGSTRSHAAAYHAAYLARDVTVVEAMDRVLEAIETHEGFKAFASVNPSDVRAQAYASAARYASETGPLSVLDGVPVAVKDMIAVRGHAMFDGSATHADAPVAVGDDPLVAKLRALGMIIVGTTTMTEGGVTPLGYSVAFEGPFNPLSPSESSANPR